MNDEVENEPTDSQLSDDEFEHRALSRFCQLGAVFTKLILTVRTDYGWLYDDEAASLYEALRRELLFYAAGFVSDSEFSYLHAELDLHFPDELYAQNKYSSVCMEEFPETEFQDWFESAPDTVDGFESARQDVFQAIGRQIHPFIFDSRALIIEANKACARIQHKREEAEQQWSNDLSAVSDSLRINTLIDELDFAYVMNEAMRTGLVEYSKEAIEAFKYGLYRSSLICARAAIEALFVYALQFNGDDAKLCYFEDICKGSSRQRVPSIERWNFYQLVKIATKQGIVQTKNLDRYALRVNEMRNSLHISCFASKLVVNASDAVFALSVLSQINGEVVDYCERAT